MKKLLTILIVMIQTAAFAQTAAETEDNTTSETPPPPVEVKLGAPEEPESAEDILAQVSRDDFVPQSVKGLTDIFEMNIPLGKGHTIPRLKTIKHILTSVLENKITKTLIAGYGGSYLGTLISKTGSEVFIIEGDDTLYEDSKVLFEKKHREVEIKKGINWQLWDEEGPFDCIIIHTAVKKLPKSAIDQIAENGIILFPLSIDKGIQILTLLIFEKGKLKEARSLTEVFFSFY